MHIVYLIIFLPVWYGTAKKKCKECNKYIDMCSNIFGITIVKQDQGCISFMLPIYNKERYLNVSIRSIIGQNYKCLEIIAIDDGSTDNSNLILNKMMKHDNRIIVYKFENNRGLVASRIQGVLLSYFDYLHPMDPDDRLPENSLNGFMNYALSSNTDMVQGRILSVYPFGRVNWSYGVVKETLNKTQMIEKFCECKMNWNIWRIIKRKVFLSAVELLMDKFFVPIMYAEDKLFIGTILLFANNYSYYPNPVYLYYQDLPDNIENGVYKSKYTNKQSMFLVDSFLRTLHPNFKC